MASNEEYQNFERRLEEIKLSGINPSKDFWPEIERQIDYPISQEKPKATFWQGALAASFLIAFFMTGWLFSTLPPAEKTVSGFYLLAKEMNAEQQQQLYSLRTGYETAGYRQLNGEIEAQLMQLALARQDITESLRLSPGDPNLLELLRWVNEQELKLLNQSYTLNNNLREI